MCDCHSYNSDSGTVPEIVLTVPWDNKHVSIDACIAHVVRALWDDGIATVGSCCGHGSDIPTILLERAQDADRAIKCVSLTDGRRFKMLAWVLAEMGCTEGRT